MADDEGMVSIRQALRVFDKIKTHGSPVGEEVQLDGIFASNDREGYTITLRNARVSLTVSFHNTFMFDCPSQAEKLMFLEKLKLIDKNNYSDGGDQ